MCKKWNKGECSAQNDKECTTAYGTVLKHVCDKYLADKSMCLKDHPRKDHK